MKLINNYMKYKLSYEKTFHTSNCIQLVVPQMGVAYLKLGQLIWHPDIAQRRPLGSATLKVAMLEVLHRRAMIHPACRIAFRLWALRGPCYADFK